MRKALITAATRGRENPCLLPQRAAEKSPDNGRNASYVPCSPCPTHPGSRRCCSRARCVLQRNGRRDLPQPNTLRGVRRGGSVTEDPTTPFAFLHLGTSGGARLPSERMGAHSHTSFVCAETSLFYSRASPSDFRERLLLPSRGREPRFYHSIIAFGPFAELVHNLLKIRTVVSLGAFLRFELCARRAMVRSSSGFKVRVEVGSWRNPLPA